jgi:hypothetical protein
MRSSPNRLSLLLLKPSSVLARGSAIRCAAERASRECTMILLSLRHQNWSVQAVDVNALVRNALMAVSLCVERGAAIAPPMRNLFSAPPTIGGAPPRRLDRALDVETITFASRSAGTFLRRRQIDRFFRPHRFKATLTWLLSPTGGGRSLRNCRSPGTAFRGRSSSETESVDEDLSCCGVQIDLPANETEEVPRRVVFERDRDSLEPKISDLKQVQRQTCNRRLPAWLSIKTDHRRWTARCTVPLVVRLQQTLPQFAQWPASPTAIASGREP